MARLRHPDQQPPARGRVGSRACLRAGAIGSVTTTGADGSSSGGVRFSGNGEGVQISLRNEGALTPRGLIGAPRRLLVRHADDERRDVRLGGRSTWASCLRTVVLLGDESPVPSQDRVGCHDAGDGREVTTAEGVAFHSEAAPQIVGQAQSPRTVHRAKDTVLLEQVLNDCLLMRLTQPENSRRQKASGRGSGSMARACPGRRPLFKECDIGHPAPSDAIDGPVFIDRSAIGRIFAPQAGPTRRAECPASRCGLRICRSGATKSARGSPEPFPDAFGGRKGLRRTSSGRSRDGHVRARPLDCASHAAI